MPAKTLVSQSEYLGMRFEGVDCEYVDGHVIERTVPSYPHSRTQRRFVELFYELSKLHPVYAAPELRNRVSETRFRVPDVAVFFPKEPAEEYPEFPPYIAIEILSPEDRHIALMAKLEDYSAAGIPHIWIVEPQGRTLSRFADGCLNPVACFELPEFGFRITPEDLFGP